MEKRNEKGFTLVELLIVLILIGILVAIAMPNFDFIFKKNKLRTSTSTVTSSLYLARMRAVNEAEPYGVQFNLPEQGDINIVRDPQGANEVRGTTDHLEDGVIFSEINFQNELAIFNEFGQLDRSCLPSGTLTGSIVITDGGIDTTMVKITRLTGRIRETNL